MLEDGPMYRLRKQHENHVDYDNFFWKKKSMKVFKKGRGGHQIVLIDEFQRGSVQLTEWTSQLAKQSS